MFAAIMSSEDSLVKDDDSRRSHPSRSTRHSTINTPIVDLDYTEEPAVSQVVDVTLNTEATTSKLTREKRRTPSQRLEMNGEPVEPSSSKERLKRKSRDLDDEDNPENVPGKKLCNASTASRSQQHPHRFSTPINQSRTARTKVAPTVTKQISGPQTRRASQLLNTSDSNEVRCLNDDVSVSSGSPHTEDGVASDKDTRAQPATHRRLRNYEIAFNPSQVESDRNRRNTKRRATVSAVPSGSLQGSDCIDLVGDEVARSRRRTIHDSNEDAGKLKESPPLRRSQRNIARNNNSTVDTPQSLLTTPEKLTQEAVDLESDGANMSYSGPTHLIFKFPPFERGSIKVTAEERVRLDTRKYLNDSLIDFYFKYLEIRCQRYHKDLSESRVFFSSFFFGRMTQTDPIDYNGVKGWTKNMDLFEQQYVFVPICDSFHWSLIIVLNLNNLEKVLKRGDPNAEIHARSVPRIVYLDSLEPERGTVFGAKMCSYVIEEWFERKEETKSPERKKQVRDQITQQLKTRKPRIPFQSNEYDCGLYVLMCLRMFLMDKNGFREKVVNGELSLHDAFSHTEVELLRGEILNLMDYLESNWKWRTGKFAEKEEKNVQKSTLKQESDTKMENNKDDSIKNSEPSPKEVNTENSAKSGKDFVASGEKEEDESTQQHAESEVETKEDEKSVDGGVIIQSKGKGEDVELKEEDDSESYSNSEDDKNASMADGDTSAIMTVDVAEEKSAKASPISKKCGGHVISRDNERSIEVEKKPESSDNSDAVEIDESLDQNQYGQNFSAEGLARNQKGVVDTDSLVDHEVIDVENDRGDMSNGSQLEPSAVEKGSAQVIDNRLTEMEENVMHESEPDGIIMETLHSETRVMITNILSQSSQRMSDGEMSCENHNMRTCIDEGGAEIGTDGYGIRCEEKRTETKVVLVEEDEVESDEEMQGVQNNPNILSPTTAARTLSFSNAEKANVLDISEDV